MIEVSGIKLSLDAGLECLQEAERASSDTTEYQTRDSVAVKDSVTARDVVAQKGSAATSESVAPKGSVTTKIPAATGGFATTRKEVSAALGLSQDAIQSLRLIKRSIDARKKSQIHFIASFKIVLDPDTEHALLANPPRGIQVKESKPFVPLYIPHLDRPDVSPVVVGAGPAGLFAALYLARAGLCPLLVERGSSVEQRTKEIETFLQAGALNPESNIQFGEGGAGTFSDGKLTTNTKNPLSAHVLHWFVEAGAPNDILWQAHPHLGSDNLPSIVKTMREEIIERNGTVLFNTQLVDMEFQNDALAAAWLKNNITGKKDRVETNALILACGHSARDVFALCKHKGFAMEQKPFSVGVRIEHPQALINKAQWGSAAYHPALGAAEYKMAVHLPDGRSVYTFCMCPGGDVVAAASEEGGIVTNGMSRYARDGKNANAAVLVTVDPGDFGSDDVLAGVELQRTIERAAYACSQRAGGKPYQAPCQTVEQFRCDVERKKSGTKPRGLERAQKATAHLSESSAQVFSWEPTYPRGVVNAPIQECFPSFVSESLACALPLFGRKLKGFDDPKALLTAPETRSSSPVRICRTKGFEAYLKSSSEQSSDKSAARSTGVFPCGEGPGFAGGIMSAAVDGLRVAREVASRFEEYGRISIPESDH